MLKPCRLAPVTEPRVQFLVPLLRQGTADTLAASVLEVQDTDSVTHLPRPAASGADLHDHPGRLVGGYDGQFRPELAVYDLEVRVTEARGTQFDKELGVLDFGDVDCD